MASKPTPLQTLFLLRLLSVGGGDYQSQIRPALSPTQRRSLQDAGLITTEKKQKPGGSKRAVNYIALTDMGWKWTGENIDAEISRSPAAAPILRTMLSRLQKYLLRNDCAIAEFIAVSDESREPLGASVDLSDLDNRVRIAYRELTGQQAMRRVRLADLRSKLGDVPGEDLDSTLLGMEREHSITLCPLDNPQERRPEDEHAALANSAGDQRHVVYMEN